MRNRIFSDYSLINLGTPEGCAQVLGAINAYIEAPAKIGSALLAAGVREFTSAADWPATVKALIEKYHAGVEEIDVGYEKVFDVLPFQNTTEDGFDILDVQSGLTFGLVRPGKKAKIYKVSGSKVSVSFDLYGGALEYLQTWFMDQKYWLIEDQTAEFRLSWYRDKATILYALIDAIAAGQNLAWQGAGTDTLLRDIETINAACAQILSDCKSKGINATPNSPFVILAPVQLRGRIDAALNYVGGRSLASQRSLYAIEAVYTMNLSDATKYYVALPGRKAKMGNRMDLQVFTELDIMAFATKAVGWGRYGAAIGEVDQFQRCATA